MNVSWNYNENPHNDYIGIRTPQVSKLFFFLRIINKW